MRGINIDGILHTGNDLDLLFTGMDDDMPSPKLLTEDIPGADGLTDYTEHAGRLTKFENRQPTFHFFATGTPEELRAKFEALSRFHGQTINVTFDDDPDFYFRGRASVTKTGGGARYAYFDLSLSAFPYKLKSKQTVLQCSFTGQENIIINNNTMPVSLTVKVKSVTDPSPSSGATYGVKFTYNGKYSIVRSGQTSELSGFFIKGGAQAVTAVPGRIVSGNFNEYTTYSAALQISFREGKF